MADAPIEATEETADENAEAVAPKKKSKLKLILMIVVPLILIGGGVAGAYFGGLIGHKKDDAAASEEHAAKEAEKEAAEAVYFALPEIIVNLQAERSRSTFLKLTINLELANTKDQPAIEKVLPRVVDNFQIYLRELRPDDLRGSAGLYRLREELLTRVNQAVAPVVVRDVLFKEMLVQ